MQRPDDLYLRRTAPMARPLRLLSYFDSILAMRLSKAFNSTLERWPMSSLTLDSNPIFMPSAPRSELIDKTMDLPVTSTAEPPVNSINGQASVDVFEQARIAFFSK
jgi:hypothetical protein